MFLFHLAMLSMEASVKKASKRRVSGVVGIESEDVSSIKIRNTTLEPRR